METPSGVVKSIQDEYSAKLNVPVPPKKSIYVLYFLLTLNVLAGIREGAF